MSRWPSTLPYSQLSMPGDLARPCYELVGTRDSVRNVVAQLVERVDLRECRDIAVRWLPEVHDNSPCLSTFLALASQQMSRDDFQRWHRHVTHELPFESLRACVTARWEEAKADSVARYHASIRPDLAHALGWWMVSRVSEGGRNPDAVGELIRHPYALFENYNAAVDASAPELSVDPAVVEACR